MDSRELYRQAGVVLDNAAFRAICENIQEDLRKQFLGDDEAKAMAARSEAQAIGRILTRLTRWKDRHAEMIKQDRSN